MESLSGTDIAPQAKWYTDLVQALEIILTGHDIAHDSNLAQDVRELLLETARNQYLAGNRSGIRWALEQTNRNAQILSESI